MRTAFVATIGGHIAELEQLAERIGRTDDDVWVTNDSPQTRDLLADRPVEMVPYIGERDGRGVLAEIRRARRLLRRRRIDRVVSTGSAIALAYLPTAAAMGIEAHYIESSARIDSYSVTGRILAHTPGVRCHWQTAPAPDGFRPIAGVYDRYRATDPTPEHGSPVPIERAVVSVGTTDRCFRRLIARLVDILPPQADVLWQTGYTDLTGLGVDGRRMVPENELSSAMADADVVVTHAGTGSLALALRNHRAPVFVPRRLAHDEHLDDHQIELARWADRQGLAVSAEADRLTPAHLQTAARRTISEQPVGRLILA